MLCLSGAFLLIRSCWIDCVWLCVLATGELGSVPEKHEGRLYNTSTVFSPTGKLIAKHRKVSCHLFISLSVFFSFCKLTNDLCDVEVVLMSWLLAVMDIWWSIISDFIFVNGLVSITYIGVTYTALSLVNCLWFELFYDCCLILVPTL